MYIIMHRLVPYRDVTSFASAKMAWSRQKTDDMLLPMMKKLTDQQVIYRYFHDYALDHGIYVYMYSLSVFHQTIDMD